MSDSIPLDAYRRADESPDELFYAQPRFVTHIDAGAIAAVTQLYREYFAPGSAVLDLMSSWVSHLPPDISYSRVAGLGMNREELAANSRLSEFTVQNLNENPALPYETASFDGCGICVSIDYLTRPIQVLREVGRVLKPQAPLVITFSNRCFPTKAVRAWQRTDDAGHVAFVKKLLRQAGDFDQIGGQDRSPRRRFLGGDPLYAVTGRSTGAP